MKAVDATVVRLLMSSFAGAGLGCRHGGRPAPAAADAGAVVTVYLAPPLVDPLMGRLQTVAARHQWALSVRTDPAAAAEADLVIADSGGALVGRVRPGAPAAAQARQLADAVLP
ncbi:MAG TPA: hypothetical protein VEU55_09250 [Gemmatimonadales bacterium]|nr:hypothetical protein [Gemmatimonadales bacterium]